MTRGNAARRIGLLALAACALVVVFLLVRPHSESSARMSRLPTEAPTPAVERSNPEVERLDVPKVEAEATRAEAVGTLEVRVLARDFDVVSPIPGARVLLFDSKSLLGTATTGEDGTCSFPASEGDGGILAWIENRAPMRRATSLSAGRATVELDRGARVMGTAHPLDGGATPEVHLLLVSDRPFFDAKDLPPAVLEALPQTMRTGGRVEGSTFLEGRFEFDGLDPAWKGALYVDRMHWLLEASQGSVRSDGAPGNFETGVLLPSPVEGLDLTILDLPVISGRILSADGSAGVPGALVGGVIHITGNDMSTSARADAEGRFRIPVDPINHLETDAWLERHEIAGVTGFSVDATSSEGTGRVQRDFAREGPRWPWNLGDIPLARTRALDFVVRSSSGEPIAGAVGRVPHMPVSKSTDAAGRGHADGLPLDANEWIVSAPGCAVSRAPIPSDPSETLQVVLARTNELVVRLRAERGPQSREVALEIAGETPLFDRGSGKEDWFPDPVQTATGTSETQSGSVFGPKGGATRFRPDADGRVVIRSLVPGRAFTIRVRGTAGKLLHEEPAVGLGPGEKRTVEIALSVEGRNFSGRVVDVDGKSISDAHVLLSGGGRGIGAPSNSRGEFLLEGLGVGPFQLVVSKPGYATLIEDEYELPASVEPVEFRLEAGRQVRVRVVDAEGAPVKNCSVGITEGNGQYARSRSLDVGVFEFPDLPARTLTFYASIGGGRYPKEHSTQDPELTIVVPIQGAIEIGLPESAKIDPRYVRLVLDPGHGGTSLEFDWTESHATRLSFGAVLPGAYEARLEQWSMSEGSTEGIWSRIGAAREIVVRANETTTIDWTE